MLLGIGKYDRSVSHNIHSESEDRSKRLHIAPVGRLARAISLHQDMPDLEYFREGKRFQEREIANYLENPRRNPSANQAPFERVNINNENADIPSQRLPEIVYNPPGNLIR
jgi:hypothetical protein